MALDMSQDVTHPVRKPFTGSFHMKISARDVDILARTLYGMARGEDGVVRQCVGWTIRNRAVQRYRGELIAVCAQWPGQYPCWEVTDPSYRLLNEVTTADEMFRYCLLSALLVVDADQRSDPTHGARHYHPTAAPGWAKTWPPSWAVGHAPCAVVGRNQFYSDVT